ncbi:hypothetical protein PsYK624_057230 [Phanerochaete sordida]|uniref:Uncharacterized protein n=1 Tax=Phanerochaete sordida TaxID=48140 RepID=A0A9P3LCI7_9APHY|nr:hypothetical protein PsYK624_057230 [Phanerochaete sordida]
MHAHVIRYRVSLYFGTLCATVSSATAPLSISAPTPSEGFASLTSRSLYFALLHTPSRPPPPLNAMMKRHPESNRNSNHTSHHGRQHHAAPAAQDMEAIARTLERIRSERDTLRLERDALRRDFDFLKAETRFTTENLKIQLQAATASSSLRPNHLAPQSPDIGKAALVSALVVQHLQSEREHDASQIASLSLSVKRVQKRAEDAERRAGEREAEMRRIRSEDSEMRDTLTTTEVKLANSERKMGDLTSLVGRLEQDLQQERADHEEAGAALSRAEAQISGLSKSLDDSESLRNSLALQVTHLQQDLHNAKTELQETEERYHVLQQQQLATMSANEATKALRRQIEELEGRVMRRTEQIGVHQHDIKKLEMNLRLQEDRVTELTGEVEVLETEKLAMVEDCRTTREERDAALRKCEGLEENVEMLEVQTATVEQRRSTEVQAMVGVVFDSVSKRRSVSHAFQVARSHFHAREQQLAAQLLQTTEAGSSSRSEAERIARAHRETQLALEQAAAQLQTSTQAEKHAYTQSQEATLALATVYAGLCKANSSLHLVRGARTSLHAQLGAVRQDLQQKLAELSDLNARYESARARAAADASEADQRHVQQVSELEERCSALRVANADLEAKHAQVVAELTRAHDQVRLQMSESTGRLQEEDILRSQLEDAQRRYQGEAAALRAELAKATEELEVAQLKQSELESAHRQALEDVSATKEELEERIQETLEKLASSQAAAAELGDAQAKHLAEIDTLTERLEAAEKTVRELSRARDEFAGEHGVASKELDEKRAEADALQRAREDLEMQLENAKTMYQAEVKILEERAEIASREKAEIQGSLAEVEVRLDELKKARDELEERLTAADADVERLSVELKAESEQRARETEQHAEELRAAREHGDRASFGHGELQQELASLREQLQQAETAIQTASDEKRELEMQMTELQAEVQRGLSFQRHLESQVQDGHKQAAALKEQVEKARADYTRSEKEAKAAEISLSLQAVQHEKIVRDLRNELESLQESSKLAETVEELREQNQEMEDLLKAKCLEIEENDDRFIELIKEKRKLTSKVDSLTRKVKSLQEKLANKSQDSTPKAIPLAATSSTATTGTMSTATSSMTAITTTASTSIRSPPLPPPTRSLPPVPPMTEMPSMSVPPAPPQFQLGSSTSSHVRATTSPTPVTRSRTPEASMPPAVFKARTPESSRRRHSKQPANMPFPSSHGASFQPLQDAFEPEEDHLRSSSSTSSTVGVKRRAPEDFEDCDAQTPRVRRALQNTRGGFTPMRHTRASTQPQPSSSSRPSASLASSTAAMPVAAPAQPGSPPRHKSAAAIADVTNSPRSKAAQKGKRKWLDALRGGRGGGTARPVTDRAQNAAR